MRLVSVADGLRSPRNVAFTPDGRILIAELAGRVRLVRSGVLLPEPLVGWPVTGIEAGALLPRSCILGSRPIAASISTT